jgi:hypothetical protein
MKAIEFEADIRKNNIEIPKQYRAFNSKHVKVILLVDEEADKKKKYDFSKFIGKLEWSGDVLAEQQRLRDEWE